jgi:hypothetical protein
MMNEQTRPPTERLEEEIAREAALAYIPARPTAKEAARPTAKEAVAEAKTFANLADDAAHGIAALLLTMDQAGKALDQITQAATAMLEKEKHARKLVEAVRDSAQK